ncbi:hypothetical protein ENUP19_0317G0006 [Entamoeba nuttalli]|uniref:Ras family protein n=1 Tax=Entamoeba nuttalli TaxID=412467 RepID=A0ABQ0DVW3_9EUKA
MPDEKTYLLRSKLVGCTDSYNLYELFTGKLIPESQGCDYENFEFLIFDRKIICQVNATLHIEQCISNPSSIRGFQILFCIYDVNDKESIQFLKAQIPFIHQKCQLTKVVVIGITDGSESSVVTEQDIVEMTLNYKFYHLKLNVNDNKKEMLQKYCLGYLLQNDSEFKVFYDTHIQEVNKSYGGLKSTEPHKRSKVKSCVIV